VYRLPPGAGETELAELLHYWESKRRGALLPSRADIDPIDLRRLLPQILLSEVVRAAAGLRFRFRLAGTAFTTLVGRDVTGLFLDELGPPDRVAPVHRAMTAVVEHARPAYLVSHVTVRSEEYLMAKRLGVPLAADGRNVDMVLAVWLARPRAPGDLASGTEADERLPILLEGN
jgi:hypothetical protein